ncbi:MAG TPA: acetate--CoA ligase [Verrucomicrobiales bacterium]|nr:acetate--CoA ligase [Pedosphaera sp.]RZO73530.1 MAG: acetate--CoA ligase [Limisphaerales bacterium]HAO66279.1 acetate--CoA ligase [Verrucomicrobiales bacterium]HAQ99405.1 acetate--CoA ligase [Verrucomicrobiales bacterium]|tara:strand:+ start:446 stop:2470 length:2025 start_codon:yes stop_codon:yes gene_type:complete
MSKTKRTKKAAGSDNIESMLREDRVFKPSKEFSKQAHIGSMAQYKKLYKHSIDDPEGFWGEQAEKELTWFKPWSKVLQWKAPNAKWFVGGQTNVSVNCLDRFLDSEKANQAAIIWEGEPAAPGIPGEERTLTYRQLHREVCQFANVLKARGIKKGDVVLIYMPMVPEAAVAMLACTRIGAIHSVVFGGFSAQSVADRIQDSQAKMVLTSDGGFRRGGVVPLKENVDNALKIKVKGRFITKSIESVIVLRRTKNKVTMKKGRDFWWHEEQAKASVECKPAKLNSEHPLFILYTSGSTGKPKGILHTTAGYLLGAKLTSKYVFDLKDNDVYWCTADIGWITGHSYVVYGPLANGATTLMYEGAPNWPGPDRFWDLVEKHRVSILYTAPTAIRAFMKWGEEWPRKHDLSSLRLLGTVGEPINPEAWMWYHRVIGGSRCPIVDTWWQTETGGIMISPLPGVTPTKPGTATLPFFGVKPEVVDDNGKAVPKNSGGKLVVRQPWPSMLRGIWGDPKRFVETYWSEVKGNYFTGDGCRQDKDGYFWIVGRIDDVLNVSGHRIGTAEVESALVSHPQVAEAAVVGRPDEIKGQALVAFVTLKGSNKGDKKLLEELRQHVGKEIGPVAKPDNVRFADALPKTRSGKIMRRLLKQIAAGNVEVQGDTSTLEDANVIAQLSKDAS